MFYLKILLSLAMTVMFFIVVFGALITVPRQAASSFSYKVIVRVTRPLRAGGIQLFFYWAAPVLVLLLTSPWAGVFWLAIDIIGVIVHSRLAISPPPAPDKATDHG